MDQQERQAEILTYEQAYQAVKDALVELMMLDGEEVTPDKHLEVDFMMEDIDIVDLAIKFGEKFSIKITVDDFEDAIREDSRVRPTKLTQAINFGRTILRSLALPKAAQLKKEEPPREEQQKWKTEALTVARVVEVLMDKRNKR